MSVIGFGWMLLLVLFSWTRWHGSDRSIEEVTDDVPLPLGDAVLWIVWVASLAASIILGIVAYFQDWKEWDLFYSLYLACGLFDSFMIYLLGRSDRLICIWTAEVNAKNRLRG